jgi:hypothetical protein
MRQGVRRAVLRHRQWRSSAQNRSNPGWQTDEHTSGRSDLGRHTLGCSVLFSQLALAAHLANMCMLMRYVNSSEYKVHVFFVSDAKI